MDLLFFIGRHESLWKMGFGSSQAHGHLDSHGVKTSIIYISVSSESQLQREVDSASNMLSERSDFHVIISLAGFEILTSSIISTLLALNNSLPENGRILILCEVGFLIKGIFRTAGLSSSFNFADDMYAAKTLIHREYNKIQTTAYEKQ